MGYKIKILSLLLLWMPILQTKAQIMSNKTFYLNASIGLARSEDGLDFLIKNSASQWTPMLNIGIGYRINKYLGVELNAATMLTELKAEGTLVSNNEKASINARHSNLIIGPIFHLPISSKSEIFLRTGVGLLLSKSEINSSSNPDFEKYTSNVGYKVTLGYARRVSTRLILMAEADFSDTYGSEDVWAGDIGLLNVGIKYSLNKNKQ